MNNIQPNNGFEPFDRVKDFLPDENAARSYREEAQKAESKAADFWKNLAASSIQNLIKEKGQFIEDPSSGDKIQYTQILANTIKEIGNLDCGEYAAQKKICKAVSIILKKTES